MRTPKRRESERKLANEYLTLTGPELPRPWILSKDGEVLARCAERESLVPLKSEVGGEIEYVQG